MNKGSLLALGAAGIGSLGIGGLAVFKQWKSISKERVASTIRAKYSAALLDSVRDSSLWEKKYLSLKTSNPKDPILKQAVEKSKTPSENKNEALELLKKRCSSIYDEKVDDLKDFSDFKSLCFKSNEESSGGTGTWISEDTTSTKNKWDDSLTKLHGHSGALVPELESLKNEIKPNNVSHSDSAGSTGHAFAQDIKTKIKNWCTTVKGEIFEGSDSIQFQNQETFCKSNS
ncbi:hypothetical protein MHC_01555 [Mycoplasma haemocanis str. Illinois]|uniref:Uncharacterized protein n=1 Tax=Mycoplasma haemocanis (strain Illinois) TaxID=1111676 RepID=H6N6A5_MYCHN|nr:hypothetical protein [Mycoplasma haemocanis]AEW45177.1 hypothetical protein MHC_01555 [Mycoplasma haemocanis str. Illinois]